MNLNTRKYHDTSSIEIINNYLYDTPIMYISCDNIGNYWLIRSMQYKVTVLYVIQYDLIIIIIIIFV